MRRPASGGRVGNRGSETSVSGKLRSIISNFLQQGVSGVDSTPSGLVEV
jgi:hypothetical protein